MGLCKCPKRRVTNQFCFEHRVNVCENCMVTNHPKCIIQSYLQWLQDSDYNPICEICTKPLNEGECIRLTCYHVFHWSCAESKYRALPRTTAPAGYQCPSCATLVFPPPNLVSPVADVLKEKLAGVNWARAGLGLPLLSEDQDLKGAASRRSQSPLDTAYYGLDHRGTPVGASDDESNSRSATATPHSIVQMPDEPANMYENTSIKRTDGLQGSQAPRKSFKAVEISKQTPNYDHDENKYKQKSTFAWISRWWINSLPSSRVRRAGGIYKRYWILLFIIIVVLVVLLLLSHRDVDDQNPFGFIQDEDRRILQKN
ncbi:zinc finger protein-like 1 homolog [Bombyx mandarina]|uniref:Zinc finger protein-like 1 homolog n=2 Tax=Bombyx TaxID=7090 RepID=A0A8R2ARF3_BOMMO|nr:zinc finger protein-like 1 homolog [Bombyx mori]XP_028031402.1 zinc finger protein-like 1 homolog [Bombyx mandarina]